MKNSFILLAFFAVNLSYSQTENYQVKKTSNVGNTSTYQITKMSSGVNQALIKGAYDAAPKFVDVGKAFSDGFKKSFNYSSGSSIAQQTPKFIESKIFDENLFVEKYKVLVFYSSSDGIIRKLKKYLNRNKLFDFVFYNPERNIKLTDDTLVIEVTTEYERFSDGSGINHKYIDYSNSKGLFHRLHSTKGYYNSDYPDLIIDNIIKFYEPYVAENLDSENNRKVTDEDLMNQLLKLKSLFDSGILTKEEFETKSAEIKSKLIN